MLERFSESKSVDSKEVSVKHLAMEILGRFRARIRKSKDAKHIEEPVPAPESVVEVATPEITEIPESISEEKELKPIKKREKKTNRGTFESVTTNNYFEGWDEDIELMGNPEIKDQIRQNIIQAEKSNQRSYEDAAADLRISVEEFKAQLQAKIEDMVERADFFRATELSVLERVMNIDGRWKNQFETRTSNGNLNPQYRGAQEMSMFGFNKNEVLEVPVNPEEYNYEREFPKEVLEKDKEKRPIYGYFSDDEHGGINYDNGRIPPPTNVQWYGRVNFKIKKERALKKATVTFHDSLSPGSNWPPTPAAKPHFTSFRLSYDGGRVLGKLKDPSLVNWGESYTEVQYHDQLTMDDVESIHISTGNGLSAGDIEEVRRIFNKYKQQHPESAIQLIEF